MIKININIVFFCVHSKVQPFSIAEYLHKGSPPFLKLSTMAFITSIFTLFKGDDTNKKTTDEQEIFKKDERSLLNLIAYYEASYSRCVERANEFRDEFEENEPRIKVLNAYIADLELNPFDASLHPYSGSMPDSTVYLAKYKEELAQIYSLQKHMHSNHKRADEWIIKICELKHQLAKMRGFK